MDRGVEKVVFDVKGTVFEKEAPCNWQPLAKLANDARLKSIFAIGGGVPKVQRRAAIDRDETAPRSQTACNSTAHGAQFAAVSSIIQQISGYGEIVLSPQRQI